MSGIQLLRPQWPAPASVRACSSTRGGGFSVPPFASLNLGDHVGDDPQVVEQNRLRLQQQAGLPESPAWLTQVHGDRVVSAGADTGLEADAVFSDRTGRVCAVLTADCLPVLFCSRDGLRVAAAHAGWRGLAGGILEATVARFGVPGEQLLVWLGPAIGPQAFEVGPEVRDAFLDYDSGAGGCFAPSPAGRWLADIYALARRRLGLLGVHHCYGGGLCTFSDAQRFFSYRRDGATGRMASLIWLAD